MAGGYAWINRRREDRYRRGVISVRFSALLDVLDYLDGIWNEREKCRARKCC
jgi:hypothetical protein